VVLDDVDDVVVHYVFVVVDDDVDVIMLYQRNNVWL
jgi:hypothetical protein